MSTELARRAPQDTDLLLEFDREHRAVEGCLTDALVHALRAGEILMTLREQKGDDWPSWFHEHGSCKLRTAHLYIRLATYRDQIPPGVTIREARDLLAGAPRLYVSKPVPAKVDQATKQRALDLVAEGWTQKDAAEAVGVAISTVNGWLRPESVKQYSTRKARRRSVELRAAREQAKAAEIKRAVRKAGAATAEAWAMAERFQDVIAQAQDETQDSEARAALSRAGEHYRKMRDEIVKALGVQ